MSSADTSNSNIGRRIFVILVAVLIAALQYRLWVGEGSLAETSALQMRVDRAVTENAIRTNRNRLLLAEIRELKTGLESIEDRARSELGMIKEGETFYLLIEDKDRF